MARIENANGLLNWKTDDEINTREFIAERSTDGRKYSPAGTVQAANATGVHQYSFIDRNIDQLGASVIYYRLKQVDIDGGATYSRISILRSINRVTFNAIPTPLPVKPTLP